MCSYVEKKTNKRSFNVLFYKKVKNQKMKLGIKIESLQTFTTFIKSCKPKLLCFT